MLFNVSPDNQHEELLILTQDKEGAWFLFQVTVDVNW